MRRDFPLLVEVPTELRDMPSTCGPVAVWQVLKYYELTSLPIHLLQDCAFDPSIGTFPIGLAVALARAGLRVVFSSDEDTHPTLLEQELYSSALALGVQFAPGMTLSQLHEQLGEDGVSIVSYETDEHVAHTHLTPVLGTYFDFVIAPNEAQDIKIDWLESRRCAPGIFRQSVIAHPRF